MTHRQGQMTENGLDSKKLTRFFVCYLVDGISGKADREELNIDGQTSLTNKTICFTQVYRLHVSEDTGHMQYTMQKRSYA